MTTQVLFYPYYAPAKLVAFEALAPGAAFASVTPELTAWEQLVNKVEGGKAIVGDGDQFSVDHDLLAQAVPDPIARHSVLQAVAAANAIPSETGASAAAAGPSAATIIGDILGVGADVPSIQQNVTDIAAGTKVIKKHWWGVELAFTKKAATALSALLGKNLGGITTLLTALGTVSGLALLGVVSGVVMAILKGLASWIDAANSGNNGVLLTMYAWIIPFIRSAPSPVTVP